MSHRSPAYRPSIDYPIPLTKTKITNQIVTNSLNIFIVLPRCITIIKLFFCLNYFVMPK